MTKKRPRYESRVFDGRIIHSAEIERIHKEVLDFKHIEAVRADARADRRPVAGADAEAPPEEAARVTVRLRPITRRERNILIALGLLLLVSVAYLAGRLAFPELWPWF
jgi:hypothetical protein